MLSTLMIFLFFTLLCKVKCVYVLCTHRLLSFSPTTVARFEHFFRISLQIVNVTPATWEEGEGKGAAHNNVIKNKN